LGEPVLSIHSTGDNDESDFTCVVVVVIGLDDDGTALGELILLLSEFGFELEAADPAAFVLLNTAQNIKHFTSVLELAPAAEKSDLDAEADVDAVYGGCEVGPSNL